MELLVELDAKAIQDDQELPVLKEFVDRLERADETVLKGIKVTSN